MDEERLNNWKIKILEEAIAKLNSVIIEKPDSTELLRARKIKLETLLNKYKNS